MSKKESLLVFRLSALGDVAMCVPVIRLLLAQYPFVEITLVTRPFFAPLFEDIPRVNIIGADVKDTHKGILGLWKLSKELQALPVTKVADLHNVLRTKIVSRFMQCIPKKHWKTIDKGRKEKRALVRAENKVLKPLKTTHERYADVFKQLGFPIDLSVALPKRSYPIPEEILNENINGNTKKWIGFAPFAAHKSKMYPLELTEKTLALLQQENNYIVLLFGGGKQEVEQLSALSNKYSNVYSVAGKMSFTAELQLISNLDVMLSMDSGNGHLAAAYQVPVVTLWGATHPYAGFAPFLQPASQQLVPDLEKYPLLPTSIYGNKVVEGYEEVMCSIAPETVVATLTEVLS